MRLMAHDRDTEEGITRTRKSAEQGTQFIPETVRPGFGMRKLTQERHCADEEHHVQQSECVDCTDTRANNQKSIQLMEPEVKAGRGLPARGPEENL